MSRRFCVRCREVMSDKFTGECSIYRSDDRHILCEPCWVAEDEEIEREGTNDLPKTLALYNENLKSGKSRP